MNLLETTELVSDEATADETHRHALVSAWLPLVCSFLSVRGYKVPEDRDCRLLLPY